MAYDPFSDGLIPVYWDSDDHPQHYMPMVNGFTKATLLSYLAKANLNLADAFMQAQGWPAQITICQSPADTWRPVPITHKFIYPLSVHWWCSHDLELWRGHLRLSEVLIKLIQAKRCKIVLLNMYEGWAAEVWGDIIDCICHRYPTVTKDDFVVVSNNVAMGSEIRSIPHVNNQQYQQPAGPYADVDQLHAAIKRNLMDNICRSWKFVSLNRQPSPGRWIVMTLLFCDRHQGLLSFGVFTDLTSYDGHVSELDMAYRDMIQHRLKTPGTMANMAKNNFKLLAPDIHDLYENLCIETTLPLIISDGIDIRTNPTADHSIAKFTDSYLHIITETYMQDELSHRMHFSEKTFKPMWYLQPFVLCGQRYALQYLRELGYATFDKWIDESYDLIASDRERIVAAIAAAKKFYDQPASKLNSILLEMMPILEHNYRCLQSNADSLHSKLLDKLRDIL